MIYSKGAQPLVSIVLVNYNGWQDTLECVASLFLLKYTKFNIVIVDNGSTDNSVQEIINWTTNPEPLLTEINIIPGKQLQTSQQLAFQHITARQINTGEELTLGEKVITLISSETNLGFAGGNNLGAKYALKASDLAYVWYLNNDTVADPDSLEALINHFKSNSSFSARLGMVGSKLRFYNQPQVIQAIGGYYNKWFAYTRHVGENELDQGQYDKDQNLPRIDYIVGASMLVCKEFIQEVGLMNEAYFLYFEEIDWINRGKALGFTFTYCADSLIYHKEGKSTGGSSNSPQKSYLADYYSVKNRIKITQNFYPEYLFTVYLSLAGGIINRIKRKQYDRVGMILKIILNSLFSSK